MSVPAIPHPSPTCARVHALYERAVCVSACVCVCASPIYGIPCKTNTAAITRARRQSGAEQAEAGGGEGGFIAGSLFTFGPRTHTGDKGGKGEPRIAPT